MSEVLIKRDMLSYILQNAASAHPKEMILLLRGKVRKNQVTINDLIIPPVPMHGRGFSGFQRYMLPMDFSIIGTVHSHPSGVTKPSVPDLHYSFGRIIMIVGFPYRDETNVAVFNHSGEELALKTI